MVKWVLSDADIRDRQFNAKGQELRNHYFYKFWALYPIRERGVKGEKCIREARIKASQSFQILEDCNLEQDHLLGIRSNPSDLVSSSDSQLTSSFTPCSISSINSNITLSSVSLTSSVSSIRSGIDDLSPLGVIDSPVIPSLSQASNLPRYTSSAIIPEKSSNPVELSEPNNNVTLDNSESCLDNINANVTHAV